MRKRLFVRAPALFLGKDVGLETIGLRPSTPRPVRSLRELDGAGAGLGREVRRAESSGGPVAAAHRSGSGIWKATKWLHVY